MALPLPRIVPDKDVQANFDELANQFPIQAANIAASQVKASALGVLVVPVSAVSTYTFTGLNGDAEIGYELMVFARFSNSGSAITLRPNGLTTNQRSRGVYEGDGLVVSQWGPNADWQFADTSAVNTELNGRATIASKSGVSRTYNFSTIRDQTAGGAARNRTGGGVWTDTTTNLTSLELRTDTGTFTGTLILRKLGL